MASKVIVIYHRFDHLHRLREVFSQTLDEWQAAEAAGQGNLEKLKRYCLAALDGFNVNLDATLAEARETFTLLRKHAPKQEWREVSDTELREEVAAHEKERHARLQGLAGMQP